MEKGRYKEKTGEINLLKVVEEDRKASEKFLDFDEDSDSTSLNSNKEKELNLLKDESEGDNETEETEKNKKEENKKIKSAKKQKEEESESDEEPQILEKEPQNKKEEKKKVKSAKKQKEEESESDEKSNDENKENTDDDDEKYVHKDLEEWNPSIYYEAVYKIYEFFDKKVPFNTILCVIHQCYGNLEDAIFKIAKGEVKNTSISQLMERPKSKDLDKEAKYYDC